jgi:hypothetical protein
MAVHTHWVKASQSIGVVGLGCVITLGITLAFTGLAVSDF